MTLKIIRSYLDFLIGFESKFGPATALAKYGREFTTPNQAPDWLTLGAGKACYKNAAHLMLNRGDVDYAEGYAIDLVGPPIPIQHAWLVDRAGNVIDPTWADSSDCVYFGVVFRKDFVCQMIATASDWSGLLANPALMRRNFGTSELFEAGLDEMHRGDDFVAMAASASTC